MDFDSQSRFATFAEAVDSIAAYFLDGDKPVTNILLGPVVWSLASGSDRRTWYFVVASGSAESCRVSQVGDQGCERTEELRRVLLLRLALAPPIVVHDFDDELEMAKWAEAIWPSSKTSELRANIEAERR